MLRKLRFIDESIIGGLLDDSNAHLVKQLSYY